MKKQMSLLSIFVAAALMPAFAMAESPTSASSVQQVSQAGVDDASDEMPLNDPQADYPGSPEKPLTRGLLKKTERSESIRKNPGGLAALGVAKRRVREKRHADFR